MQERYYKQNKSNAATIGMYMTAVVRPPLLLR
jgi:hypothetical protein